MFLHECVRDGVHSQSLSPIEMIMQRGFNKSRNHSHFPTIGESGEANASSSFSAWRVRRGVTRPGLSPGQSNTTKTLPESSCPSPSLHPGRDVLPGGAMSLRRRNQLGLPDTARRTAAVEASQTVEARPVTSVTTRGAFAAFWVWPVALGSDAVRRIQEFKHMFVIQESQRSGI